MVSVCLTGALAPATRQIRLAGRGPAPRALIAMDFAWRAMVFHARPHGTRTPAPGSCRDSRLRPAMKPIRKAIFPVAGLGTRFLPATKAMPKEMLTVVDRPLIQHVVDEAREAGIEHFIFVTGRNKGVIEDHFDRQFELEADAAGKEPPLRAGTARRRPARRRPDQLHPPAVAARPRPRGVVRARTRRQRAVRAAAARRAGAGASAAASRR